MNMVKGVASIKKSEFKSALDILGTSKAYVFERAYSLYRLNELQDCLTLLNSLSQDDRNEEVWHLLAQVVI
jgi:hypothetical protein